MKSMVLCVWQAMWKNGVKWVKLEFSVLCSTHWAILPEPGASYARKGRLGKPRWANSNFNVFTTKCAKDTKKRKKVGELFKTDWPERKTERRIDSKSVNSED
jgi:hypothetical protein